MHGFSLRSSACTLASALMLVLALTASLQAATWYVKPDGSGDVPTIDDAVTAAASGDTILLADGTFSGDGNRDIQIFYNSLTVRSESGDPDLCIIDSGGSVSENHLAFDIRFDGSPPVLIYGITIQGGYSTSCAGVYVGIVGGASNVTIVNCVFTNNTSVWGGGAILVLPDCSAVVAGSRFTGNSAPTGGAMYLMSNTSVVVGGCTFSNNSAADGGAVWLDDAAASFTDCAFSSNSATSEGGALYAEEGSAAGLLQCTMSGNDATGAGGAIYAVESSIDLAGCVSLKNKCPGVGSSMDLAVGSSAVITTSTFVADSSGDAVIFCGPGVAPTLDRTVIAFGMSTTAITCINPAGSPTLACCDIYGNDFGNWVDCIAGQAGVNGNISQDPKFCDIPTGDVTIEDCSPCLAANNSCNQDIGARATAGCGCGEETEPASWGAIKAIYR
jgi:predicted outer membrane repeat protein